MKLITYRRTHCVWLIVWRYAESQARLIRTPRCRKNCLVQRLVYYQSPVLEPPLTQCAIGANTPE